MRKKLIITIGVLLLAILIITAILLGLPGRKKTVSQPANPTPAVSQPPAGDGKLKVTLKADKPAYKYGDTVKFSSEISNVSATNQEVTFSTTCTQGKLYIAGEQVQRGQVCGDKVTTINLEPGQSRTYDYQFKLVEQFSRPPSDHRIENEGELRIRPGSYEAYLDWQGHRSPGVIFQVNE